MGDTLFGKKIILQPSSESELNSSYGLQTDGSNLYFNNEQIGIGSSVPSLQQVTEVGAITNETLYCNNSSIAINAIDGGGSILANTMDTYYHISRVATVENNLEVQGTSDLVGEVTVQDKIHFGGDIKLESNIFNSSIAIGSQAGKEMQSSESIAIGKNAGSSGQQMGSIAIGTGAGKTTQGTNSIAIGYGTGEVSQGSDSIAIGSVLSVPDNSVILSANGIDLEDAVFGGFHVKPIRKPTETITEILAYNKNRNEIIRTTAVPAAAHAVIADHAHYATNAGTAGVANFATNADSATNAMKLHTTEASAHLDYRIPLWSASMDQDDYNFMYNSPKLSFNVNESKLNVDGDVHTDSLFILNESNDNKIIISQNTVSFWNLQPANDYFGFSQSDTAVGVNTFSPKFRIYNDGGLHITKGNNDNNLLINLQNNNNDNDNSRYAYFTRYSANHGSGAIASSLLTSIWETYSEIFVGSLYGYPTYTPRFGFNLKKLNGLDDLDYKYYINGYSSSTTGAFNDFTGQHRCFSETITLSNNIIGYIVSTTSKYKLVGSKNKNKIKNITINDSLPIIELSSIQKDKKVFGVISDGDDKESSTRIMKSGIWNTETPLPENDLRLHINSLGEGAIWVSDFNGPLENGDYITTSNITGIGMKQDNEMLMNYTVAKITMDCDFNPQMELEEETDGQTYLPEYKMKYVKLDGTIISEEEYNTAPEGTAYKMAFVGCTYHCG